jgi:hypothetical protein
LHLDQGITSEGKETAIGDDDMVQQVYVEGAQGIAEIIRPGNVMLSRTRISGGMIVDENQG